MVQDVQKQPGFRAKKEKPILFSGDMIRAILENRKTQTRRVIKPQPNGKNLPIEIRHWNESTWRAWCTTDYGCCHVGWCGNTWKCPYGVPGSMLWVRETWQMVTGAEATELPAERYRQTFSHNASHCVVYAADGTFSHPLFGDIKWKPSIHMFHKDSRINLAVKDVRVERVQDISEDDAQAEGIFVDDNAIIGCNCNGGIHSEEMGRRCYAADDEGHEYATDAFEQLWDSINGKPRKDGTDISWAANPWVFVVEFEKIANG